MGGECSDFSAVQVGGGMCRVDEGSPYAGVLTNSDGVILADVPDELVSELKKNSAALQLMKDFKGIRLGSAQADGIGVRRMLTIPSEDDEGQALNWTRDEIDLFRRLMDGQNAGLARSNVVLSVSEATPGVMAVNYSDKSRASVRKLIVGLKNEIKKMKGDDSKRFQFALDTLSRHYVQTWPNAAAGDKLFADYLPGNDWTREVLMIGVGALVGIVVFALGGLASHKLIEWSGGAKKKAEKDSNDDDDDQNNDGASNNNSDFDLLNKGGDLKKSMRSALEPSKDMEGAVMSAPPTLSRPRAVVPPPVVRVPAAAPIRVPIRAVP